VSLFGANGGGFAERAGRDRVRGGRAHPSRSARGALRGAAAGVRGTGRNRDAFGAQSARLRISEELVDEALVEAAAATRGVTVGEDEIDARVEPGAGDEARARVRRELLVDRLAGVAEEPPSDVLVEAFYADNILAFVPVGAPSGTAPRPLAQVREEIRAFLGASLRAARRDALRRELRFTIPFTNTVALALGDLEPPRLEDIVLGVPPSSANPASLSIVVPRSASGSLR
jgi:hypothetical protein